jgi:2,3-bisphosphoglycerate-independent phosphoglycerate mutase
MESQTDRRTVALVILDGWGYAPRTEGNAIAVAHTPYYDEICRKYPMTTLAAAGTSIGRFEDDPGHAEVGHLNLGTGRVAATELARIRGAIDSGEFQQNQVLNRAFEKARANDVSLHLIGLISDAGVHSSTEHLFALLRMAKRYGLENVYIHCILDGRDVPERTADIYVEALEIKLADIGIGRIASLCGRFFAMDTGGNWERTARAFTMLAHAEGERTNDAVAAVRNSFLRGISDEFIAPIIVEWARDIPVTAVRNGDLVVFFNHRGDAMRQLVRSLCIPDGAGGAKPVVDTVCLTEYDRGFNLPAAFRHEEETNSLTSVLAGREIPTIKITESARAAHLTHFFDGGSESRPELEEQIVLSAAAAADLWPESQSFKIADRFRNEVALRPGFYVVNMPAAELMAAGGEMEKTVAAIRYMDTCIGGIYEAVRDSGGVMLLTSSHGHCEEMVFSENGEPNPGATRNPVPLHYIDDSLPQARLGEGGALRDVAPTILGVFGIETPAEMTGRDLRIL